MTTQAPQRDSLGEWLGFSWPFWWTAGAAALLLSSLVLWSIRSYHRGQIRDSLNGVAAFATPPLEIVFPDIIADNDVNRAALEAGVRGGVWGFRDLGGSPATAQVVLSRQGQRWFSVINSEVTAVFTAGTRHVTRVTAVQDTFPSRRVHYYYIWTSLHPGTAILGMDAPELGKEYEGDAIFFFEGQQWRLLHWSTPDLDVAVGRFHALQPNSSSP